MTLGLNVEISRNHRKIAVAGKGRNCPHEVFKLALEVGREIGSRHDSLILLTGGLGGVMAAASSGCRSAGGFVVSLVPGTAYRTTPVNDDASLVIDTGLSVLERNVVLACAGDAMVALPGSHGLWQEMAVALDVGKPVWAIGEHTCVMPGVEILRSMTDLAERLDEFTRE
jgi:uncharacterized protein (TIGR00725 family)